MSPSQEERGRAPYPAAMQSAPAAPTIVWLRHDLRIADNAALTAAVRRGQPVVAIFILEDDERVSRPIGAAGRWWLHGSLSRLGDALARRGSQLLLRRGSAPDVLAEVIASSGADALYWNRRYGVGEREQDTAVKSMWRERGLDVRSFPGSVLNEPWTVHRGDGEPYAVFSAYWRAASQQPPPRPLPAPETLPAAPRGLPTDALDDWKLLPTSPDWAGGFRDTWAPGEDGAAARLEALAKDLPGYATHRNEPSLEATSRLSPHLRFGEISPAQIWHRLAGAPGAEAFLREVGWRDFNYSLLFAASDLAGSNLRPAFDDFPWQDPGEDALRRWQQGRTGFPLVDAGMRQLWHTGWMHNRVRMVTASFLIKNLLIDWRVGERWFWDTLVDSDPANNAANWQWVAGSGVDAAPFFRVFNPVLQAQKFDPDGTYVRAWVPELAEVPTERIFEPRDVPGYPAPMVDLKATRAAALAAFASISGS